MKELILSLDPGSIDTGYTLIDVETCKPYIIGKDDNEGLYETIYQAVFDEFDENSIQYNIEIVIEDFQSYGKFNQIGETTIRSIWWAGRFYEQFKSLTKHSFDCTDVSTLMRRYVKLNICGATNVTDGNIASALAERFAPGESNKGKGTKKDPGWFYGFKADIWQAYALAVTLRDIRMGYFKVSV